MKLSKTIPARKKNIEFSWIRKDFMVMGDEYRQARASLRNPLDRCFWCNHKFEDGEPFALGSVIKKGNKVLCHECADAAIDAGKGK